MKEDVKKMVYAVLRCPEELLELMKRSGDLYRWEHGGWKTCFPKLPKLPTTFLA